MTSFNTFKGLTETLEMPRSEAYRFFLDSFADHYEEEFTKGYPTGDPLSMQNVYDHARTF